MSQVVHKTGPLKQHNKSHKNGRHKTKGEINADTKGRIGLKMLSVKGRKEVRRADRRNQLKQLRANKRHETMSSKRSVGIDGSPPHLIVVVPLSEGVDDGAVRSLLSSAGEGQLESATPSHTSTLVYPNLKQRFTFLYPSTSDLYSLLDVAKVADTLMLVYRPGSCSTEHAQIILDSCIAQGLPATVHVAQGLDLLTGKALSTAKKTLQKAIEKRFPNEKIHQLNSVQDAVTVLRCVSAHKRRRVLCRDQHSHLIGERIRVTRTEEADHVTDHVTLEVSGYVRVKSLSVNSLVHIPGVGDFQLNKITAPRDPAPLKPHRRREKEDDSMAVDSVCEEDMEQEVKVLEIAHPAKQESLVSEVVPDAMDGEQTWPTEEELKEAEAAQLKKDKSVNRKRVPKGTSDYQACWIVDSDSEQDDNVSLSRSYSSDDLAPGEVELSDDQNSIASSDMDTEMMTLPDTDKYDDQFDEDGEQKQLELLRAERDNQLFPDEVDTPTDTPVRERFQKYRGLKSFLNSPWDPKENLPSDYARIFQFANFAHTRKRVLNASDGYDGALTGWYVTIHIKNVPRVFAEQCASSGGPLVVYSLLPHENKMSVIHFVLRRTKNYTLPIKSKDQLVFHTGLRRFAAGPIFSQHTAGDKHKFERFFPSEGVCVASVYAPIGYPPQPILVFKPEKGCHILVATGSLYRVDPNRVVCKRIALSGHPYKINRKSAVIRYMFFNRDDINWFKPVELKTKCGRRGHIKQSLGTHGHMKCIFDGHLKSQDTVLMNLYKRIYPKWTYQPCLPCPETWGYSSSPPSNTEESIDIDE